MTIIVRQVAPLIVEKIVKQLSYWTQHHAITSSEKVTTELRRKRKLTQQK